MPWWAWIWVALIAVLSIGGTYDDLRSKKPLWYSVYGLLTGILCALFVASHFRLIEFVGPPQLLLLLSALAGGWIVMETANDLKDLREEEEEEFSPGIIAGSALFVGIVFLSAVALGIIDGIRQL